MRLIRIDSVDDPADVQLRAEKVSVLFIHELLPLVCYSPSVSFHTPSLALRSDSEEWVHPPSLALRSGSEGWVGLSSALTLAPREIGGLTSLTAGLNVGIFRL